MQTMVEIMGRDVSISVSSVASKELEKRTVPLVAEMELYFSCLIRKRVRFHEMPDNLSTVPVMDKLHIAFHPVMTAACGNDYEGDEPPLTDFPIQRPASFVPQWLNIDFRHHQWQGEFGFK